MILNLETRLKHIQTCYCPNLLEEIDGFLHKDVEVLLGWDAKVSILICVVEDPAHPPAAPRRRRPRWRGGSSASRAVAPPEEVFRIMYEAAPALKSLARRNYEEDDGRVLVDLARRGSHVLDLVHGFVD